MDLVTKIFETLDVSQLALLQMALVIVLALVLSATLVKPLLRVFQERDNLSVKPVDEARRMMADAESRNARYEEELRKAAADSLARKRKVMDEASKAERKKTEVVIEETNARLETMKAGIAAEKEAASAMLRGEVSRLSLSIAEKVLGRQMA